MFAISVMKQSPIHPSIAYMEFESPLQRTSEWNHQRRAEASAGMTGEEEVSISLCKCDSCGIHVGPGHVYQSLYLYPVEEKLMYMPSTGTYRRHKSSLLKVCEGCAVRKKIPEAWCLVNPFCWSAPEKLYSRHQDHSGLLPIDLIEGTSQLFTTAISQRFILPKLYLLSLLHEDLPLPEHLINFFFLYTCFLFGIPLSWVLPPVEKPQSVKNTIQRPLRIADPVMHGYRSHVRMHRPSVVYAN